MFGDDAGRCSSGLTVQKLRVATEEEQITFRKWMRRMIVFYGAVLLIVGVATMVSPSAGLMQLSKLSVKQQSTQRPY